MAAPAPRPKNLSNIKSSLLRPSLTSHFQCFFNPPPTLRGLNLQGGEDKESARTFLEFKNQAGVSGGYDGDLFSLLCSEASLPGSSLATHELNNDFTGVTERHAYRRLYDDRADFTFYVDHDHRVLTFFETWMSYIVNEQYAGESAGGIESPTYNYRVNYPNVYRTTLYIHKFEKDYQGRHLQYRFLQAYPISINSMPVSYDTSQILKCTVSFTYTRYVINRVISPQIEEQNSNENSPGNPDVSRSSYGPAFQTDEEAYRQAAILRGELVDTVYGENSLPPLLPQ